MNLRSAHHVALALAVFIIGKALAEPKQPQTSFSPEDQIQWQSGTFRGQTTYRLTEIDGRRVLSAISENGASWLKGKVDIDLARTPCVTVVWRADRLPDTLDERAQSGDDFVNRMFLFSVPQDGQGPANLTYVWARHQPVGTSWPDPYTIGRVLAIASGESHKGEFVSITRNVRRDFQQIFGRDIARLHLISIMSDSDDSHSQSQAAFGEISFTATCPASD